MAAYDYLNQSMVASALIQPRDDDSFYHPELGHTGFAADGTRYTNGVQDPGPVFALWYKEIPGPYRSSTPNFPNAGLILLSRVALTILDESDQTLPLWMKFLLSDSHALANNFDLALSGFLPTGLAYADGIISVTYKPDPGSITITSNMIVSIDFTQDQVYLDVAV